MTGALHMGHALNNTLQDVLIRWRRMQGYNALWMPGTDHAGIATQAVVERRIREEEKKTRHDLGREELVQRIWQWKDQYEARILGQLRELGCSCDWQRTRFTLDPMLRPRRAADVLQDVPGRPHLPRQTAGELGHAAANLRGRRRDLTPRRSRAASGRSSYPVKGTRRVHPLLDDAARDDARRHRRGRASRATSATST